MGDGLEDAEELARLVDDLRRVISLLEDVRQLGVGDDALHRGTPIEGEGEDSGEGGRVESARASVPQEFSYPRFGASQRSTSARGSRLRAA